MNIITLYVSVGLEEGIQPNDVSFIVYEHEIEEDGFLVYRNGAEDGKTKIRATDTWILGRTKEDINFYEHSLVLEIEVPIDEEVNPDEVTFTVESAEVDGFEINVAEKPSSFDTEYIVDADETYIRGRYTQEKKPEKNKVFVANFNGHYLRGVTVVTAPNLETAYQMVKKELESQNLAKGFTKDDVYEIDIKKQQVDILYDGQLS